MGALTTALLPIQAPTMGWVGVYISGGWGVSGAYSQSQSILSTPLSSSMQQAYSQSHTHSSGCSNHCTTPIQAPEPWGGWVCVYLVPTVSLSILSTHSLSPPHSVFQHAAGLLTVTHTAVGALSMGVFLVPVIIDSNSLSILCLLSVYSSF